MASKRVKKIPIKKLILAIDDAFKAKIFARDVAEFGPSVCPLCQKPSDFFQWCHMISAAKYATRWNPLNVYRQCRGCNLRHEFHPQYFTDWWLKRHGAAVYHALVFASNQVADYKRKDYEKILGEMK